MRQTSIEAFNAIREGNLLSGLQFQVYEILFTHGPLTAGECAAIYRSRNPLTNRSRNEIAKRVSDLVALGVAHEIGSRRSKVTGMRETVWTLSDRLPERKSVRRKPCLHCEGRGYFIQAEQVGFSFTGVEA